MGVQEINRHISIVPHLRPGLGEMNGGLAEGVATMMLPGPLRRSMLTTEVVAKHPGQGVNESSGLRSRDQPSGALQAKRSQQICVVSRHVECWTVGISANELSELILQHEGPGSPSDRGSQCPLTSNRNFSTSSPAASGSPVFYQVPHPK